MHYGVSPEDEGVGVNLRNDTGGCSADMGHNACSCRCGADGLKVRGVKRWVGDFVDCRVENWSCGAGGGGWGSEFGLCGCVPGHTEAVDVEELVAEGDFGLGCRAGVDFGVVGEEEGKVMMVYLFGDCVGWGWKVVSRLV